MKKLFIIALPALMILTCCNNATDEEKLADYKDASQAIVNQFNTSLAEIDAREDLSQEAKREMMEARQEAIIGEYKDLAMKTIRKNRKNKVAAEAFKDVEMILEPEEKMEALAMMSDEVKADPEIAELVAQLEKTKPGAPFIDFTIVQDENDPENTTVSLSDYVGKGKYILVDFWASWCGPCKAEIPNIKAVYDKYHGDDFDVVSVAVWDKPEDTKVAAQQHGVVWNQIINAQKTPTDLYGIKGIPHIILFAPDGTFVADDLRGSNIEKAVAKALGR